MARSSYQPRSQVGGARDIYVDGATQFIDRLRTFDRAVYDELVAELEGSAENVRSAAAAMLPDNGLSGWGPWGTRSTVKRKGAVRIMGASKRSRDLGYDRSKAAAKLETKVGRKFRRGDLKAFRVFVQQMDAAGAIYELAGSQMRMDWGATGGSGTFRDNLNKKRGSDMWPRTLTPALYEEGPAAYRQVQAIIEQKKRESRFA